MVSRIINDDLITAALTGDLEFIKKQLDKGANINYQHKSNNDWTSLHYAVFHGYPNCINYLIEKGADVTILDRNGKTAFELAFSSDTKTNDLIRIYLDQKRLTATINTDAQITSAIEF